MLLKLYNIYSDVIGDVNLEDSIFGLTPRGDIIKRVVDWQRSRMMLGTHQVKTVSQVSGTTKKPFKQKGTGNARLGSLRAVQLRGGGISHGPVTRSHSTDLPKKIRTLGLKYALSDKCFNGKLFIIDDFLLNEVKTNLLYKMLLKFNSDSLILIDNEISSNNFSLSLKNIKNSILLPVVGINVYDLLKYNTMLLSKKALDALHERLR